LVSRRHGEDSATGAGTCEAICRDRIDSDCLHLGTGAEGQRFVGAIPLDQQISDFPDLQG
jgi:hypothetical protein